MPTWSDVKANLAEFDRAGLLGLVQDLYAADKNNQAFLHAQFGLGGDVLAPYKARIDRWLWPDGGYFDALVRMFEQALKGSATLPARQRDAMLNRLDAARRSSHNFGYGVGCALDDLFSKYGQT